MENLQQIIKKLILQLTSRFILVINSQISIFMKQNVQTSYLGKYNAKLMLE